MGAPETRIIEGPRAPSQRRSEPPRRLVSASIVAAVAVRLAVAAVLIAGPATDEPAELAGWDAERFQEIAERSEPAWAGQPVEYPPGSVVVLDRLAGDDVVATHRRLVALSVAVDLATAVLLWRRAGRGPGAAYLLLGLPLVPLGYQRLDTLVTALATVALVALLAGARRRGALDLLAGAAIAVGALTKVWPLVLVAGALAIGRWRAAAVGLALTGLLVVGWLVATGDGLDPVDQVLSLRGATGWHVESLPGALAALAGHDEARLELNAYRIGDLRPGLVTAGRIVTIAAVGLLVAVGRRGRSGTVGDGDRRVLALTGLGAVAALLVTAPLLSPQFLVWTTPLAALLVRPDGRVAPSDRPALALAALAAVLTGLTLTVFRPDGLASTVPASLLTARNLALAALVPVAAIALTGARGGAADP